MSDHPAVLRVVRPHALVPQLAAESLRDAILSGRLGPGERLIEAALTKSLGISRPSLREAISQLGAEKLVTITPNRGAAVAVVNWDEAAEIYDVRALLEGEAGYRFANLATRPDIEKMHRALRRFAARIRKERSKKTGFLYRRVLRGAAARMRQPCHLRSAQGPECAHCLAARHVDVARRPSRTEPEGDGRHSRSGGARRSGCRPRPLHLPCPEGRRSGRLYFQNADAVEDAG